MLPIFGVQIRAKQFMRTVVEIYALLCFIENRMIEEFSLIKTCQGNIVFSFKILVGGFRFGVVEESIVDVGIPPDVNFVMKKA